MNTIRNYSIIEDTANHDLVCDSISIAEAAIFATLTDASQTVHDNLLSITFPAGLTLYGNFTSITLVSGAIIAYNIS